MPRATRADRRRGRRAAQRAVVAAALGCLTLALAPGCRPAHAPGATYRELHAATDSLLVTGRLEDASRRLHGVADGRAGTAAAEWERAWARARAASVDRMLALPESARVALAGSARPVPAAVPEDPDAWAWLRPALERQLEVRRHWLGDDAPDVAETMTALARLERRKGAAWRARKLNEEALRIRRRAFGPESPEVAESHLMLGRDHKLASTDLRLPGAHQDSALAIRERLFGGTSLEVAEALLDRANTDRWLARVPPAVERFRRALAIRSRILGPRSPGVAEVLADLAVTRLREERWPEMERFAAEAVDILDERGGTPTTAYALSLNLRGLALRHLGRFAEAAHELERAASVQETLRGAAPDDDLVRRHFHLLAAYSDLAAARLLAGDSLGAWVAQERGTNRSWVEREWKRGNLDPATSWDRLLERVQSRLPDSTALIGWLDPINNPGSHGNPFWAWVVRRNGSVQWVEMQAQAGDPRGSAGWVVYGLFRRLEQAAGWPFEITPSEGMARARRDCWDLRFRALEPLLHGVRDLVVVSSQVNSRVPLEVMVDSGGRVLDDRFTVSYSPSVLHFAGHPAHERSAERRRRWRGVLVRAPGHRGAADGADDLQWADREVAEIAGLLGARRVLSGPAASERGLRRLHSEGLLGSAELLHIASHAQAAEGWSQPAWLALAEAFERPQPGAPSPPERDGLLSTSEVGAWNLGASLVTLASCRSGGALAPRTEDVVGLGNSFLDAGARSVVVSLWPVDDAATERLMGYFYEALFEPRAEPCSIAGALREARTLLREYRAPDGRQPFAHPALWGGFVVLGDPG